MQGGKTLLLIDDDEDILSVTKMMLEASGFSVLSANDGRKGINIFREHSREIKAALIDLIMPNMDGIEVFHELKKIRSDVKAILISGYNTGDRVKNLSSDGFVSVLFKPYDVEELLDTVRAIIAA